MVLLFFCETCDLASMPLDLRIIQIYRICILRRGRFVSDSNLTKFRGRYRGTCKSTDLSQSSVFKLWLSCLSILILFDILPCLLRFEVLVQAEFTSAQVGQSGEREGHDGPYTLKRDRLGLLGTYGAPRSVSRAHWAAPHRKGPSYLSFCVLLGAELSLHNSRPSLDRDKWLGWRTQGEGAPASSRSWIESNNWIKVIERKWRL